jgi:hypothetical protein
MEDGGVDATVIECRQHLLGQMADFLSFITFSVSDLKRHNVPQIKCQTMRHTLMNLLNTALFEKYVDP